MALGLGSRRETLTRSRKLVPSELVGSCTALHCTALLSLSLSTGRSVVYFILNHSFLGLFAGPVSLTNRLGLIYGLRSLIISLCCFFSCLLWLEGEYSRKVMDYCGYAKCVGVGCAVKGACWQLAAQQHKAAQQQQHCAAAANWQLEDHASTSRKGPEHTVTAEFVVLHFLRWLFQPRSRVSQGSIAEGRSAGARGCLGAMHNLSKPCECSKHTSLPV
ncbi:hypothetical protein ASPSYDRAFT_730806 [Aspergillus sydowii CBS 593.65]|uniref:Uncharacterized protein n=1 Tax=Aspergillus sydowii CBS 593.65 TaxID=1036612 RepID=A0A1L9TLR1_9EURO|nr:uncharacterized protein ASPSYDRAFT_730806 [Aspergillus sydowii CBS 593.65]OJJ60370.1 hypothetical protein ASPSYDRAFT_730806 [Aspergillus sydowii CBS 593.65]